MLAKSLNAHEHFHSNKPFYLISEVVRTSNGIGKFINLLVLLRCHVLINASLHDFLKCST